MKAKSFNKKRHRPSIIAFEMTASQTEHPARLSDRVRNIPDKRVGKDFDLGMAGPPGVSFVPALAAIDEFPIEIWERLRAEVLARNGADLLQDAASRGDANLRKAIAAYLCDFRGARCHADQIVITAGTQQAMLISALALVSRSEVAWIEDPGYQQARRVFAFAGATLVPRPVDQEGITIAQPSRQPPPKIIFVTPSHQFPLGMAMSFARRTALIDFARTRDAFIFEDDHSAEFRFTGPPLPCLQGHDNSGRVIYAGSMSKTLFPSLRLGYLLVPEQLVSSIIKIRCVMDQHPSTIDQATLGRFISEGFSLATLSGCRNYMLIGEGFSLSNSTAYSMIASFCKFPKVDFISLRRSGRKQIYLSSRVSRRRSESHPHRCRSSA